MAKDFGSNRQTIKRIFSLDLLKKCYEKISVHSLKEDQKPARKICCQWIRKNIDRSKVERLIFTNEKIFLSNGFLNPKNDVARANDRSHANEHDGLHLMKKYPISIMIALSVTRVARWKTEKSENFLSKSEKKSEFFSQKRENIGKFLYLCGYFISIIMHYIFVFVCVQYCLKK